MSWSTSKQSAYASLGKMDIAVSRMSSRCAHADTRCAAAAVVGEANEFGQFVDAERFFRLTPDRPGELVGESFNADAVVEGCEVVGEVLYVWAGRIA